MLDSLRKSTSSLIGYGFIAVLVLSFAVWGIADIFGGFSGDTVAEVGDEEITAQRFLTDYNRELSVFSERIGRPVTPAEGRALGLDRQVLQRLVGIASLDAKAEDMGLAVSDETIAREIRADPSFHGPFGRFDKQTFDQVLFTNGLTEELYIEDQRGFYVRSQLLGTVVSGPALPERLARALHAYTEEQRVADYIVLPPRIVGDVGEPSEEEIEELYRSGESAFTRPETRSFDVLIVNPDDLADEVELSDDELRDEFELRRAEFDVPERRDIDQITFPTQEAAEAAAERLAEGVAFATVVEEQGLSLEDVALGNVTREGLLSEEVADAAFALDVGETSAPVEGPLGPVILRVNAIEEGRRAVFEEVREEVARTVALERAEDEIFDFQNVIEDERAGGATLQDIAGKFGLEIYSVDEVTAQGLTSEGRRPQAMPAIDGLVEEVFEADVGQELDPGETPAGGFYWIDVTGVTPAEPRPLEAVRDDVIALWKEQSAKIRLSEIAAELAERANSGESLEAIATEYGRAIQTTQPITRRMSNEVFSRSAVANLFGTPEGETTWGPVGFGDSLVLMRVADVIEPDAASFDAAQEELSGDLKRALDDDLTAQFVAALQDEYGVRLDQAAFGRLFTNLDQPGGGAAAGL